LEIKNRVLYDLRGRYAFNLFGRAFRLEGVKDRRELIYLLVSSGKIKFTETERTLLIPKHNPFL
jgi:hypothetical protein